MTRNRNGLRTGRTFLVGDIEKLEKVRANYCGTQIDEALSRIEKSNTKVRSIDAAKHYVELFLEDIQKDVNYRQYVPTTVPTLVIDPTMIEKPYTKRLKGETIDEIELKKYFRLTVYENKGIFGYDPWEVHEQRYDSYISGKYYDYKYSIYEDLKFDASYEKQCDDFLKKLYDFYKPSFVTVNDVNYYSYELFAALIKHQIWSIKNKLAVGENDYPIFLNIEGSQGCGKSTFTRHFGQEMLKKLYVEVKTDVLNDNFAQTIWNKKLIANFEDLDKEDTVGNGKLKRFITQKDIFHRGMRTEDFHDTPNRTTLFSTSNYAIWEIFNDKTGMRRYADLKFTRDDMKNDKAAQAYCDKMWNENKLALWKGVDEHKPMGYVFGNDMASLLDLARTTYIASNDTVKKWLDKNDLKVVSNRCANGKTVKEAYEDYVQYTDEKVTCNYENFVHRIQSLYTGGKPLKPSKLKIVPKMIAMNDNNVQPLEINPFAQYAEFVPFEKEETWRNETEQSITEPEQKCSPCSPCSPYVCGEKNETHQSNQENEGEPGEPGEPDVKIETSKSQNSLESFISKQNKLSDAWNRGEISHDNEYVDDEDEFFKRVRGEIE